MKRIKRHPYLLMTTLLIVLIVCFFIAINLGSIKVSFFQLLKGLFIEYDQQVASVYQIRFPRIIVTILSGYALALSGLLFQVVLKNPLADPGLIGISSGAYLTHLLVGIVLPELYTIKPLLAGLGGLLAFILIYGLSWHDGLNTTRVILVGVAIHYFFNAIIQVIESMTSSSSSVSTVTLYSWHDVQLLFIYLLPLMIMMMFLAKACDLMNFSDRTLLSLGVPVNTYRLVLSLLAVMMCSISVAVVGILGFIALLVPHLARLLVGSQHRYLIPTCGMLGAIVLLLADTIGRVIVAPYEIAPSFIMAIIGAPLFIILLKRSQELHGD